MQPHRRHRESDSDDHRSHAGLQVTGERPTYGQELRGHGGPEHGADDAARERQGWMVQREGQEQPRKPGEQTIRGERHERTQSRAEISAPVGWRYGQALRAVARAWRRRLTGLRQQGDADCAEHERREEHDVGHCQRVGNPLGEEPRHQRPYRKPSDVDGRRRELRHLRGRARPANSVQLGEVRGCGRRDDPDRDPVDQPAGEEAGEGFHATKTLALTIEIQTAGSNIRRRPYKSDRCPARSSATTTPTAYTANATVTMNSEKWSRARYRPYSGLGTVPNAITIRNANATTQNPRRCRRLPSETGGSAAFTDPLSRAVVISRPPGGLRWW